MNEWVESVTLIATFRTSDNIALTSPNFIRAAGHSKSQYKKLIETIQKGFPKTCCLTPPRVNEYWEVTLPQRGQQPNAFRSTDHL